MSAQRPLSPHLQVYRLPLTGLISISHRITGIFLTLGLFLFVLLLFAMARGEAAYASVQSALDFWLFQCLLWGFIYALWFHVCHGIRHLIWDVGKTFDRATLNRYAAYELAASLLLTFATFLAW
ncbi:MAG: succinate dehydrogenase, cytochrome b556 subunit [Methylomonas sp.]|nr:succinate dehydrogenase, cytochrome b556 subunit [Methylomonas sp.]PPD20070.1 MAG: succinate dehydrogenase, cytochrome b556 subunit [Methylomonas sp.]PPD25989.1 MAG: succinate dehydrogenase, cytochrome b556 subunit [Methylomonas sp.]PPD37718.1 MAG: succinate dehydrogenase, cytochrome b556 subunit [Methylomonas sp.]PPD39602.1 MAG: succinate dehydrogenase, cytochrome b556 subunit [Methylomonas sp.]